MPVLWIQTNVGLPQHRRDELLARLSGELATALGKPERYVMVILDLDRPMLFAKRDTPAAYLELKSLGLSEDQTTGLSQLLCRLMESELGIPQDRVYIEFANPPRPFFGWNGGTF
jgi:hypothetical protein